MPGTVLNAFLYTIIFYPTFNPNHKPVKKILVFTSLGRVWGGGGDAHLDDFTADDYTVGK